MTAAPNFYMKARSETAELLNYDLACLTPDQSLRLDCAVALRLALDDLQGRVVRGESIDVARMLTASEALSRLLPPTVLATPPAEQRSDPRETMWLIYKQMRERGELSLKALPPEDHFQHRINELEVEIERLKAGAPAPLSRATLVKSVPRGDSTAIDPPTSDIVPPGERAECDAGSRAAPDDLPPRSLSVIEGKAVRLSPTSSLAASAAPQSSASPKYDYSKSQDWKNWIEPDGSIRSTPRGPGRYWGPV